MIDGENALVTYANEAIREPVIPTGRQPNLFTMAPTIGPAIYVSHCDGIAYNETVR